MIYLVKSAAFRPPRNARLYLAADRKTPTNTNHNITNLLHPNGLSPETWTNGCEPFWARSQVATQIVKDLHDLCTLGRSLPQPRTSRGLCACFVGISLVFLLAPLADRKQDKNANYITNNTIPQNLISSRNSQVPRCSDIPPSITSRVLDWSQSFACELRAIQPVSKIPLFALYDIGKTFSG